MVSSCSRKICRAPKGTCFPQFHSLCTHCTRQISVLNPTQILLQVHVPLNVHQNHWMLMMFNFDKKEIQTLNSMNYHCDKTKEDSLVSVLLLPLLIRMEHELPKYRNPMYNSSYPRWTRFSSASTKLSRMGWYHQLRTSILPNGPKNAMRTYHNRPMGTHGLINYYLRTRIRLLIFN